MDTVTQLSQKTLDAIDCVGFARADDRGRRFVTIEAWTRRGLQRFVILFFMELSTRKVEIAGIASSPSGL